MAERTKGKTFNPEGAGFDTKTAKRLIEENPLTIEKPSSYIGDEVANKNSFQAWVWHPEINEYKKHSSSRDPETGLILKGKRHKTFNKTVEAESRLGFEITKKGNRYYSNKPKRRLSVGGLEQ